MPLNNFQDAVSPFEKGGKGDLKVQNPPPSLFFKGGSVLVASILKIVQRHKVF
jgi:hypothetical protein